MNSDRDILSLHVSAGTVAKVISVALLFVFAYILRDIILVVVAAVVIASSIEPMVHWCRDRGIPRLLSVLIIYISFALIFIGTFYFLVIPLFGDMQDFLNNFPEYIGNFASSIQTSSTNSLNLPVQSVVNSLPLTEVAAKLNVAIAGLSQGFFVTASTILGGVLSFFLIIVLSFYLSVQQNGIANFLKTVSPARHRKYVASLWNRAETKIGLWMQGQLLLAVIVGVLTYLGLTLIGVNHALLLGFLTGLFELIPLFGPILAAVPAIAVGFAGGGVTPALLVLGLYLIVQQFESQLIYPLVVKKVVGVPPIISILALVIGAKLAGFLGLLLAVPIAAILMEIFNDLEKTRLKEEEVEISG